MYQLTIKNEPAASGLVAPDRLVDILSCDFPQIDLSPYDFSQEQVEIKYDPWLGMWDEYNPGKKQGPDDYQYATVTNLNYVPPMALESTEEEEPTPPPAKTAVKATTTKA